MKEIEKNVQQEERRKDVSAIVEPPAGPAPPETMAAEDAVSVTGEAVQAESLTGPEKGSTHEETKEYAGVSWNGRGANIRAQPSLATEVLRAVPPGYPLAVLQRQGDWVLVQDFRDRQGWVYASLLTDRQAVVVKVGKGNMRSGPSLIEDIVAKLDYGTVMQVEEISGGWVRVTSPDGLTGWLHSDIVWP
jgi:SH3-like domain-containing protein